MVVVNSIDVYIDVSVAVNWFVCCLLVVLIIAWVLWFCYMFSNGFVLCV